MGTTPTTRTLVVTFDNEEHAHRFDLATTDEARTGIRRGGGKNHRIDLLLEIEYAAADAINDRPFTGRGDPDAEPVAPGSPSSGGIEVEATDNPLHGYAYRHRECGPDCCITGDRCEDAEVGR